MNNTVLKIRLYGDSCLVEKSAPVKEVGPAERILIQSMIATMHEHKGIGLSAPQVGINQCIFVADIGDGPIAVINPEIKNRQGSAVAEEGCLSIPGVVVEVSRPSVITVQYMDENNKKITQEFSDLFARVFLHETDHLDGKLIFDYVKKEDREELIKQYEENIKKNQK